MTTAAEIMEFIKNGANEQLEEALAADPVLANGKTDKGISLLSFASYYRNKAAIESIKKRKTDMDIFEAAGVGAIDIVENEIKKDPNLVNAYSPDGFTPLGLACYFGQHEMAKFLVENGADVNIPSNNLFKVAPLHSAASVSDFELVKMLVEHKANVNAIQQGGHTPLHAAAHNGKTELAKYLIDHGADVNIETEKGETALDKAKEKGFMETAKMLIENGGL